MYNISIKDNGKIDSEIRHVEILSIFLDNRKQSTTMLLSGNNDVTQIEVPLGAKIIIESEV